MAFFAYPDVPGTFVPEGCRVDVLTEPGESAVAALTALAEQVGGDPVLAPASVPGVPDGPLDPQVLAAVVARCCRSAPCSSTSR